MRVIDFFDRGAAMFPDRAFLVDDTGIRTYRESQILTHKIANALHSIGFRTESKAAVYSSNVGQAFECILGVLRAGGAWVPVNARNPVSENSYILHNFDVEILLFHSAYEANISEIRQQCPNIRHYVCIDRTLPEARSLDEFVAPHGTKSPEIPERPESVIAVFSTGGTTGKPKGVVWPNRLFETMTANFYFCMPPKSAPVHLAAAPLTHAAGGFALMLNAVGTTNIILQYADPVKIMEAIERHRVTHLFLPPTVIYMMLAHPRVREFDYSSLQHFIYAAAPMSVEKLRQAIEVFGPVMTQVFGQVEAPIMCTCMTPEDHNIINDPLKHGRLASCGRPTLFTSVEIMDDDGRLLEPNEKGEIVVRGNLVMAGYYKNPEATAEVSTFGWHHTGDVGYKDEDGFVYIVDRKKDMIISGGFNVYPSEIEQVIWAHPAVQDCAVIGVPDEKWGEAVKAIIELKPGASTTSEEIIAICKEQLGSVKAPKSVEFWPSLPRTPVGKVLKRDIRQKFWEGRERLV